MHLIDENVTFIFHLIVIVLRAYFYMVLCIAGHIKTFDGV